jgi:DNA-binding SARP family transcriptional activator
MTFAMGVVSYLSDEAIPTSLQRSGSVLAHTLVHKAPTRIQLCGRLAVELAGRDATPGLQAGHARLLFTFLAVHRERDVRRDELKEALWPRGQPAGADNALSALLSRLRRALGHDTLDGRGAVRLILPTDAWIDFEAAESAIHRAESAVARQDWGAGWGPALVALLVARRGFLPGEEAPWVLDRRRRLDEVRIEALECYAAVALGLGGTELALGEKAARELVVASPYRERGHQLLMALLTVRGNPAEALRIYETLRERLRDELGATPAPALREMQARLLRTGELVS